MKFRYLVMVGFLLAGFGLTGCDSNPYGPGEENTVPAKPEPDPKDLPPPKTYALNAPVSVTCHEAVECTFAIEAVVTGDQPAVTFENLPPSATYSADTGLVTWKPTQAESTDPADVKANSRIYAVIVSLKGAQDLELQKQITVVLIAKAKTVEPE